MMKPTGRYRLIDVRDCKSDLNDPFFIMDVMIKGCDKAKATIVNTGYQLYTGRGVTVMILLDNSHGIVTTYPEYGMYFIDVFTTGDIDPKIITDHIVLKLGGQWYMRQTGDRGE